MSYKFRYIFALSLVIIGIAILLYSAKGYIKYFFDDPVTTESVTYENDYIPVDEKADSELLLYSALTDEGQKEDYKKIYSAIASFKEKTAISAANDINSASSTLYLVLDDHPEIFWVSSSVTYSSDGVITFTYTHTQAEAQRIAEKIDSRVDDLMKSVDLGADDYTVSLKIYDLVARNITYDDGSQSGTDTNTLSSIEGAVINRNALCGGYTRLMQYMLGKAGLRAAYVSGDAIKEDTAEGHAWLLHEMDGEFYYSDPTWGDCFEQEDKNPDLVSHTFFGMTKEDVSADHTLEERYPDYPANSLKDNYFHRENLLFGSYSAELIAAALEENTDRFRLTDGSIELELRYTDEAQYNEACNDLIEQQNLYNIAEKIDGIDPFNITFSQDAFRHTVMIYLKAVD